jgi:hypothetical protein
METNGDLDKCLASGHSVVDIYDGSSDTLTCDPVPNDPLGNVLTMWDEALGLLL